MSNCPKCGNPLQEGITTCPICGTNIAENVTPDKNISATPVAPSNENTSKSVEQKPLQNNPVVNETTINKEVPTQNETTTNLAENKSNEETNNQVKPSNSIGVVEPEGNTKKDDVVIPTSLTKEAKEDAVSTLTPAKPTPQKPKFKLNMDKKTIMVIAAVFVFIIVIIVFITFNGGKTTKVNNNPSNQATVAKETISNNGYKLKIENNWECNSAENGIIITNPDESIAIKIVNTNASIDTVNESIIKEVLSQNTTFENTVVNETSINAKKSYLINGKIENYPVQVYIISGGENLMIGATIVYQSDETKNKYEASITEIIGSLTYENDEVKALDTLKMYENIFSIYDKIVKKDDTSSNQENNNPPVEQENDNPSQEQPLENGENTVNEITNENETVNDSQINEGVQEPINPITPVE